MPVIESSIDTQSDEFRANADALLGLIGEVDGIRRKVVEKSFQEKPKFDKRGQILPHERLSLLLDPGSPFVELCPLAGYQMHDDKDGSEAGGGIIAGIGYVSGVRCLVSVNNSAIKGGTISPAGLHKSLRLQRIAFENRLPGVTLSESGGANLNYAAEVFVEGARTFANQARASAAGLPQITVVHGNATAGGAYQPGLSDYVILVKGRAKMFLAGPPLLLAATGEIASDEELGGAEMHACIPGTAEYMVENDAHGVAKARELVAMLGWQALATTKKSFTEPLYPVDDLLGLVPSDPRKPYDMREIIARLVDGSDFLEFKNEFDDQTLCGWAGFGGITCGIITNNGPITAAGAVKAAQFIQLCDQTKRPLVFLHNTTGFMVGKDSERNGIIKHGSKMIQAVANARVPKMSIVIGGSYGAGNYAMCGRGLDPTFIFAWPNSRTAVMGGAQAGKVLRIVTEAKFKRRGQDADPAMLDMIEKTTQINLDKQSTALYGTARLWDDGLIDPRDTRKLLMYLLEVSVEGQQRELQSNTFGVARL